MMPKNSFTRLVVKNPDEYARTQIITLCQERGWHLYNLVDTSKIIPPERVYLNMGDTVSIHYINDKLLDLTYIVLYEQQENANNRFEVVKILRNSIEFYEEAEIRELMAQAGIKDINLLKIIGISAPQHFNADFMRFFEKIFTCDDSYVQFVGVTLSGYIGWHEFKLPLEQLGRNGVTKQVQDWAKATLTALEKTTWNVAYDPQLVIGQHEEGTKPFLADVQKSRYASYNIRQQNALRHIKTKADKES